MKYSLHVYNFTYQFGHDRVQRCIANEYYENHATCDLKMTCVTDIMLAKFDQFMHVLKSFQILNLDACISVPKS